MNLTVGPLPPAVYWRRRAIVLVAVLALVLLVVAMCNGSGPSTASVNTSGSPTDTPRSASPTPATAPSVQAPIVGAPGGPSAAASATADATATPAPTSDQCTDAEIQLTPSVQKITGGTYPYQLNLRIRNISTRTCKRDVGAGPQEMHIVNSAGQTLWSSDNCQSGAGSDVRTFGPNIEDSFWLGWDGNGNGPSCTPTGKLLNGNYQIVAKLDTKVSASVPFTIGPAGK